MKMSTILTYSSLFASIFVASITLSGCNETSTAQPSASVQNQVRVEQNQQKLQKAQPAPTLDISLERANLIERAQRLNKQNAMGYITLLSYGRVIASYPIRGKATSLNAYLQSSQALVKDDKCEAAVGSSWTCPGQVIEQPDIDGTYGNNDNGIFFFTADTNTYVEWNDKYLYSDAPIKVNEQPLIIRNVE